MTTSIIYTKLRRPPILDDHVQRLRLLNRLDSRLQRPLTLIAAPAGYGKSTLASSWVERFDDWSSAWISLDDKATDLHVFLSYLLAAIKTIAPDAGKEITAILKVSQLPQPSVLEGIVLNDLDLIHKKLVLVLDDYHKIINDDIHSLLTAILSNPPRNLHIVIVSRIDPPLPLPSYRAKGLMTEIRAHDLRFSLDETTLFLRKMVRKDISETISSVLGRKTEGWITGLRLAALSMRHHQNLDDVVERLPNDNRLIMDYLVAETLSLQPAEVSTFLIKTSILDRFNSSLCQHLCDENEIDGKDYSKKHFLDWLLRENLFVISLDHEGKWFRYHHLFQDLLSHHLASQFSDKEIKSLHLKAGQWYAVNGIIDDALDQLFKADDAKSAARLIAERRHELMNAEHWAKLERWLKMFKPEHIDSDPDLLLLKAWLCENYIRPSYIGQCVELAEPLIIEMPPDPAGVRGSLKAELYALKSYLYYINGDGEKAVYHAQRALSGLVPEAHSVRGWAQCLKALGYQMSGELRKSYNVVHDELQKEHHHSGNYRPRLLITLGFVHWISGNLHGLIQCAEQLLKIGQESDLPESISLAHYYLGISYYLQNKQEIAEDHLNSVVEKHFAPNMLNYTHSAFALALSYQVRNMGNEANQVILEVIKKAFDSKSSEMLQLGESFQAELALRQGNLASAVKWAETYAPEPFHPGYRFYVPQLTFVKVMLLQNTAENLHQAAGLLETLLEYYQAIHNIPFQQDVLILQTMVQYGLGERQTAMDKLTRSLSLAESGCFVQPYLDFGQEMFDLLSQIESQVGTTEFCGTLLNAFQDKERTNQFRQATNGVIQPQEPHLKLEKLPLTNREIELLRLLTDGSTNDQIAEKLSISKDTVKKHLYNSYKKLEVKNRRQAVLKAETYGLL